MQVKCCECGYESNTVDDFLHISLEITRAHSLTKALQRFTTGECLDQENKYKCPKQVSSMLPACSVVPQMDVTGQTSPKRTGPNGQAHVLCVSS